MIVPFAIRCSLSTHLDVSPRVGSPLARRRALARALLHDLKRQARAAGPPTEEELSDWTARRWLELDRPEAARTVHAVVLVKKPQDKDPARALATVIAEATRGATDREEFLRRARAVPGGELKPVVQPLPAICRDGRGFRLESFSDRPGPTRAFDKTFAAAANDIARVGEQSGVVESPFGFHVIYLVERIPALQLSRRERLAAIHEDVIADRVFRVEKGLRDSRGLVEPNRAFDTLTRQLLAKPGSRG